MPWRLRWFFYRLKETPIATVNQVQLVAPVQLAATDAAAVYTAPASTTAKIGRAVFTNTTAGGVTLTRGGSPGGGRGGGPPPAPPRRSGARSLPIPRRASSLSRRGSLAGACLRLPPH